jgi:hypothetical protein
VGKRKHNPKCANSSSYVLFSISSGSQKDTFQSNQWSCAMVALSLLLSHVVHLLFLSFASGSILLSVCSRPAYSLHGHCSSETVLECKGLLVTMNSTASSILLIACVAMSSDPALKSWKPKDLWKCGKTKGQIPARHKWCIWNHLSYYFQFPYIFIEFCFTFFFLLYLRPTPSLS